MIFRFIYQPSEYYRIIPAINIEARGSIAVIKNQIGSVIKAYNDTEISKIQSDVLFYKIETTDGVLAGYCLALPFWPFVPHFQKYQLALPLLKLEITKWQ